MMDLPGGGLINKVLIYQFTRVVMPNKATTVSRKP
jgi:hypothetical protein